MATWHTVSEALDVVRDGINTSDMSEKIFAWVDSARALAAEVERQKIALDAAEQRAQAAEAERDELQREIAELRAEQDDTDWIGVVYDLVDAIGGKRGQSIPEDVEWAKIRAAELRQEVERLRAVMDAADAFLAEPPEDMCAWVPFNQYTTAEDCRKLNEAYREAAKPAKEPTP
jgi:FtsZ-binding cell division protein ZapB